MASQYSLYILFETIISTFSLMSSVIYPGICIITNDTPGMVRMFRQGHSITPSFRVSNNTVSIKVRTSYKHRQHIQGCVGQEAVNDQICLQIITQKLSLGQKRGTKDDMNGNHCANKPSTKGSQLGNL